MPRREARGFEPLGVHHAGECRRISRAKEIHLDAGIEAIVPFLEMTQEQYQRVLDVNLKGEWLCAQAVVRQLVAQKKPGAIVNVASIQSGMALPGRSHYAPSKRGVEALTRNLSAELAEHNIRVNCINPGLIATDMTAWVIVT